MQEKNAQILEKFNPYNFCRFSKKLRDKFYTQKVGKHFWRNACWLVGFHGNSNLAVYFKLNPVSIYLKYIRSVNKLDVGNIFKRDRAYFYAHS